jgi:uncharacterized protein YodC (DUF2158 family)
MVDKLTKEHAMDRAIEVGEVVVLNSGGPNMTVTGHASVDGRSGVRVRWEEGGKLVEDLVPVACVSPARASDAPQVGGLQDIPVK